MIQTNNGNHPPPSIQKNKSIDNDQHANEKREEKRLDDPPGKVKEPSIELNPQVPKVYIPNRVLASCDIKLGYFDSSVVPSSIVAKEYIIGGS